MGLCYHPANTSLTAPAWPSPAAMLAPRSTAIAPSSRWKPPRKPSAVGSLVVPPAAMQGSGLKQGPVFCGRRSLHLFSVLCCFVYFGLPVVACSPFQTNGIMVDGWMTCRWLLLFPMPAPSTRLAPHPICRFFFGSFLQKSSAYLYARIMPTHVMLASCQRWWLLFVLIVMVDCLSAPPSSQTHNGLGIPDANCFPSLAEPSYFADQELFIIPSLLLFYFYFYFSLAHGKHVTGSIASCSKPRSRQT